MNLFEEVVVAEHGADTWDPPLDPSGLHGAHTRLGNQARDSLGEDLERLVTSGAEGLEPQHEVNFRLTVDEVIHTEVGALTESVMTGGAPHNNEQVRIAHESCMCDSADHCTFCVAVEEG